MVSDDNFDALSAVLANDPTSSTVNRQQVDLSHYRYEEVTLSVEQIADPTFPLRDIQSSCVKILVALMSVLAFDYRKRTITVTRSAVCNHSESMMHGAVADQHDRNIVKNEFKMMILNGRHCCSTVLQLKADSGHKHTERTLRVTQIICQCGQAILQPDVIKLSRITSMSTAIGRTDRSFQPVMKAVLNYTGVFELRHGVSFVDIRVKYIVATMIQS